LSPQAWLPVDVRPSLVLGDDNKRCTLLDPDGNPVHAVVDATPASADKPGLLEHKAPSPCANNAGTVPDSPQP
jgi:hypothetical protein